MGTQCGAYPWLRAGNTRWQARVWRAQASRDRPRDRSVAHCNVAFHPGAGWHWRGRSCGRGGFRGRVAPNRNDRSGRHSRPLFRTDRFKRGRSQQTVWRRPGRHRRYGRKGDETILWLQSTRKRSRRHRLSIGPWSGRWRVRTRAFSRRVCAADCAMSCIICLSPVCS